MCAVTCLQGYIHKPFLPETCSTCKALQRNGMRLDELARLCGTDRLDIGTIWKFVLQCNHLSCDRSKFFGNDGQLSVGQVSMFPCLNPFLVGTKSPPLNVAPFGNKPILRTMGLS